MKVVATGRCSLVDKVHARLKQEILQNRMAPGYQAMESELAAAMGMSRTPVREALLRLQSEGLIEVAPRRGMRVLPISATDMREIYQLLTALEPEAAAMLAAMRPDQAQLADLETSCAEMEKACSEQDLEAWAKADDRFHRQLVQRSGNSRLANFVGTLYDQAHRARMITLRLREFPVRSTQEHRDILDLIASGLADEARQAFYHHRKHAADELLALLEHFQFTQL